ncbi:hypothetical protein CBR_g20441 [Chara braunii]|uniref:Beta-Casp domain-containing protein n=1 Tax=Chara braunii TaxID=69332 RepID=A0A388JUF4_CHABU|nr:hypothetical protein CBR_g20441 [Chara braunii]|eukprot:GBG61410.1 hypothetical protein CBR_g20441 [Chara braunii]
MFDCGMHMGYSDERRFPDFSSITKTGNFTDVVDVVVITHFHLDHCGALPYFTEVCGYDGPIYMTYPTKALLPLMLEDYRKVMVERKGETEQFNLQHIKQCLRKVSVLDQKQTVRIGPDIEICAFYAGHVIGAAMFYVRVNGESVMYTGDYNVTPDRHMGSATVDRLRPDLFITESTYATTVRDSKKAREREFLNAVYSCVSKSGKVLIPVFALGRAQELCILLDEFWEQMNLKVPIYFSAGLTAKANLYYRLFINWANEKVKDSYVSRNTFDFKNVQPFDRASIDQVGACVLFATPGMLHGGLSLEVFKHWASSESNMVVIPGYCVAGTVGNKLMGGKLSRVDVDKRTSVEVRIKVHQLSFTAHVDAKGILRMIHQCEPRHVMLVHGEKPKMFVLQSKIERELHLPCHVPPNGKTIVIPSRGCINLTVSRSLVKSLVKGELDVMLRRAMVSKSTLQRKTGKINQVVLEGGSCRKGGPEDQEETAVGEAGEKCALARPDGHEMVEEEEVDLCVVDKQATARAADATNALIPRKECEARHDDDYDDDNRGKSMQKERKVQLRKGVIPAEDLVRNESEGPSKWSPPPRGVSESDADFSIAVPVPMRQVLVDGVIISGTDGQKATLVSPDGAASIFGIPKHQVTLSCSQFIFASQEADEDAGITDDPRCPGDQVKMDGCANLIRSCGQTKTVGSKRADSDGMLADKTGRNADAIGKVKMTEQRRSRQEGGEIINENGNEPSGVCQVVSLTVAKEEEQPTEEGSQEVVVDGIHTAPTVGACCWKRSREGESPPPSSNGGVERSPDTPHKGDGTNEEDETETEGRKVATYPAKRQRWQPAVSPVHSGPALPSCRGPEPTLKGEWSAEHAAEVCLLPLQDYVDTSCHLPAASCGQPDEGKREGRGGEKEADSTEKGVDLLPALMKESGCNDDIPDALDVTPAPRIDDQSGGKKEQSGAESISSKGEVDGEKMKTDASSRSVVIAQADLENILFYAYAELMKWLGVGFLRVEDGCLIAESFCARVVSPDKDFDDIPSDDDKLPVLHGINYHQGPLERRTNRVLVGKWECNWEYEDHHLASRILVLLQGLRLRLQDLL